VCADPAGLPFSSEKQEGFENDVASLLARDLGARLEYTWWVQRRGFFRNTLNASLCDVVIGVPKGLDLARTTRPWYRSTFTFVSRADRGLADLCSIDDPRMPTLRIGVPLAGDDGANPPPIHALARRGMVDQIRGFHLYAELGRDVPAAVEAVAKSEIDVAILWGPVAGAGAKRAGVPLVVTPLAEDRDGEQPFTFAIAMATRRADVALADELDRFIERRRDALDAILKRAGVPTVPASRPPTRDPETHDAP
jgi:quinoprotein dehydrogenase-associated probable ABC transporter substrate-binding protein